MQLLAGRTGLQNFHTLLALLLVCRRKPSSFEAYELALLALASMKPALANISSAWACVSLQVVPGTYGSNEEKRDPSTKQVGNQPEGISFQELVRLCSLLAIYSVNTKI